LSTHTDARHAVIGFCTNQDPTRVGIFAASLRSIYNASQCDVVLYVDRVDPPLSRIADEFSVEYRHTRNVVSSKRSGIQSVVRRSVLAAAWCLRRTLLPISAADTVTQAVMEAVIEVVHHPFFARFICYADFLRSSPHCAGALLTDVKDVVFQGGWTGAIPGEDSPVRVFRQGVVYGGANFWDSWDNKWYRNAFGRRALRRLFGQEPVCAGTIMGGRRALLTLCEDFISLACQWPFLGVDQPAINHLILTASTQAAFEILDFGQGEVLTLGSGARPLAFGVDESLRIIGPGRRVFPIVHMWDRFPETKDAVFEKWKVPT
jgi:hypothetical protein